MLALHSEACGSGLLPHQGEAFLVPGLRPHGPPHLHSGHCGVSLWAWSQHSLCLSWAALLAVPAPVVAGSHLGRALPCSAAQRPDHWVDAPKQEALRLVSRPPDEVPSPQEQGSDPVLPPLFSLQMARDAHGLSQDQ